MIAPPPVPPYYPESAVFIRDFTYELLKTYPEFGGRVSKVPIFPTKDDELPALQIKFGGEEMSASSDRNNQGSPKFDHRFTLIISILISGDSDVSADGAIMRTAEDIKQTLLTSYAWVNQSEGVIGFNTSVDYPREVDLFLCVVNMEIVLFSQSIWEPLVPHDLREIDIKRDIRPNYASDFPTITDLVPDSGYITGGTPVAIIGTYLGSVTSVTFGGVPALSFLIRNNNLINCVAPPGAANQQAIVSVVNVHGTGSSPSPFFYSSFSGVGADLLEDDIIFMGTDVIPPGT